MKRPSILIVEDNAQESSLLEEMMLNMDVNVHTAPSATEAIEMDHSIRPKLTIVDYHLPDSDGELLVNQLRSNKEDRLLVIFSSDSSQESILRGLAAGADNYWCKPMTFKELIQRINALLISHHRQQAINSTVEVSGYLLDFVRHRAMEADKSNIISLNCNETKTLRLLTCYLGQTVHYATIQRIATTQNSSKIIDNRTIKNVISSLRKKLPNLNLVNDSKIGYRLDDPAQIRFFA